MDALPLDPGTYRGTYKLVGGQPSLDLINTVSWPGTDREHDWFEPPTNVTLWAVEVGLIDGPTRRRLEHELAGHPNKVVSELAEVRTIRETLRAAVSPLAHGLAPHSQWIDGLNELLADISHRRRLHPQTLQWSWPVPTNLVELMAPVIWNAAEVLSGDASKRLGYCPACDWLFHDTTRSRSRRWCDMGDCGSRDKALRYYHRRKPAAGRAQAPSNG